MEDHWYRKDDVLMGCREFLIDSFEEEDRKKIYDSHYSQIGKEYFKAKKFKQSVVWAKKTSCASKCVYNYFVDGVKYLKRKFL